jgi:hypothetical protein
LVPGPVWSQDRSFMFLECPPPHLHAIICLHGVPSQTNHLNKEFCLVLGVGKITVYRHRTDGRFKGGLAPVLSLLTSFLNKLIFVIICAA